MEYKTLLNKENGLKTSRSSTRPEHRLNTQAGMLSIYFRQLFFVNLYLSLVMRASSSSLVVGLVGYVLSLRFNWYQTCSIGFKSGLWAGHFAAENGWHYNLCRSIPRCPREKSARYQHKQLNLPSRS